MYADMRKHALRCRLDPKIGLFKRFQQAWVITDSSKHSVRIDYQYVVSSVSKDMETVLHFAKEQVVIQ